MKKKISKIVAVFLAAIMIIAGISPVQPVQAAEKMNFNVKVSSATVKPGDTITAELWLPEGGDVVSFVGNFTYDTKMFDLVKKKIGPVCEEGDPSFSADPGSISIVVSFDQPYNAGGLVYTLTLKVKDTPEAGATGALGFDFRGGQVGKDANNPTTIPAGNANANVKVTDKNGNTVKNGKVTLDIPVNSISLDKSESFTLSKGSKDKLNVIANPTGSLEGKTVAWSTSNKDVVKVDQSGNIEAVGKGTATITATVEGKIASVQVTVNNPLKSISLNKTELALRKGKTEKLSVTYHPEDADEKDVTWTSSNPAVATVTDGKVDALKDGTTVITAAVGDKTATCTVTVKEEPLQSISLNKTSMELVKTENETLEVTYNPVDTTDDKTVTWTSANTGVATVENGVVTGVGVGTTTITATVGNKTATCDITVTSPLKGIKVNPADVTVLKNQSQTVSVEYLPADTTDDKTITWSIDNSKIADIAANGAEVTITGKKQGAVVVTATSANGFTSTCKVEVKEVPITAIKLDVTSKKLESGEIQTVNVEYLPADTTDEKAVTWKSSNTDVATVDENGVITAVAGGQADITATTANGVSAICKITVPIHLNGISLEKTSLNLRKGQSSEALSVVYDPVNTTDELPTIWSSSDESVATVNAQGVVTGLKEGTATIKVQVGTFSATCEVTVSEIHVNELKVAEDTPSTLYKGQSHKLNVKVLPEYTTDDVELIYESSDDAVATVSADGTVTAVKEGTAQITIKTADGRVSTVYEVTVKEIPLQKIVFQEEVTPLEEGQTAHLSILYNPADTTDAKDVTWSSSDESVATIDQNGLLTAVKAGKTTITAKVGDKEVSYELTVTAKKIDNSNNGNNSGNGNGSSNNNSNVNNKNNNKGNAAANNNGGNKTAKVNKTAKAGTVKTGDTSHVLPVALTLLFSFGMIVLVMMNRKKRVNR